MLTHAQLFKTSSDFNSVHLSKLACCGSRLQIFGKKYTIGRTGLAKSCCAQTNDKYILLLCFHKCLLDRVSLSIQGLVEIHLGGSSHPVNTENETVRFVVSNNSFVSSIRKLLLLVISLVRQDAGSICFWTAQSEIPNSDCQGDHKSKLLSVRQWSSSLRVFHHGMVILDAVAVQVKLRNLKDGRKTKAGSQP